MDVSGPRLCSILRAVVRQYPHPSAATIVTTSSNMVATERITRVLNIRPRPDQDQRKTRERPDQDQNKFFVSGPKFSRTRSTMIFQMKQFSMSKVVFCLLLLLPAVFAHCDCNCKICYGPGGGSENPVHGMWLCDACFDNRRCRKKFTPKKQRSATYRQAGEEPGWDPYWTKTSKKFYQNRKTKEVRWEVPKTCKGMAKGWKEVVASSLNCKEKARHGQSYYYNVKTKEVRWEMPYDTVTRMVDVEESDSSDSSDDSQQMAEAALFRKREANRQNLE